MALGENLKLPSEGNGHATSKSKTRKPAPSGGTTVLQNSAQALRDAVDTGWASIEFTPDGTILSANDNFVKTLGYDDESDIIGQHHRIFCDPAYTKSADYKQFWADLAKGQLASGEFRRLKRDGQEVWINASYTPIKNEAGEVTRVIKIAADVTDMVAVRNQANAIRSAVDTGWASIEFKPDGTILGANENFVHTLGYDSSEEIEQKHHRIFCDPTYANSAEYKQFWANLAKGQQQSGEFKRYTRDGSEVWINASYTPIKNDQGEVLKVIKIAANINDMVSAREQSEAIKSAVDTGWASIEFEPDGTILKANENFVHALGYTSEDDLVGNHHRMFCESEYANSAEYLQFWKDLASGKVNAGEFKRLTKDGHEVWINASYTPIRNSEGKVWKVIKIASDITSMVRDRVNAAAVKSAVDIAWASIEFYPDGTIIDANENFVKTLGYNSVEDIAGQHHRIFCDSTYTKSKEYEDFWKSLADGQTQEGEFRRVKKNGEGVWITASYTPVRDAQGKVFKVIKIASDISIQKNVIQELQRVVKTAGQEGDLKARVNLKGAEGDFKILSDSVNRLIDNFAIPIDKLKNIIIELSQGNLTEFYDLDSKGDIKEMGDAFNTAVNDLNELMQGIQELANLVAASSEEMTTKGEEMKGSTAEMSSAIQQMAEGVQDQSLQVDEISKMLETVLSSAKEMAFKSKEINGSAKEGTESSKAGTETIRSVVESMTEIQTSAEVTSKSINTLTNRSEEIARTLNVITDIASQTNLLALNAAIEAARAGDAGRGFAVVAEEIRKLAEDSRNSAQEIEKVINEVQKDIDLADKSIQGMEKSVKTGNRASKEAEQVFEKIDKSSTATYERSEEITKGAKEQEESINNAVKSVEKIVVVSEETASGTEQVASSAKELRQGMDEVSATSKDLADVANQLMENVSKFKLNEIKS